jgi:hypothetical protein
MSDREPATPDDLKQSKRFIDMAREIGADEDPEAFEKAFRLVIPHSKVAKNDGPLN